MGETQMVAYNPNTGYFLKKGKNGWIFTADFESASGLPQRQIQLAVARIRESNPGAWMIMRRQDADKMVRNQRSAHKTSVQPDVPVALAPLPGVEHPSKIEIESSCPSSEGSQRILSLVSGLEAATSVLRMQELQAQVAEYDKMVLEIYHYIEANQLDAAKGYKAYRNLRNTLLRRRALKNELHIVSQFRAGRIPDSQQIESCAKRIWSPDIEELMNR